MDAGTTSVVAALAAANLTQCKAWCFGLYHKAVFDYWKNALPEKALHTYSWEQGVSRRCFGVVNDATHGAPFPFVFKAGVHGEHVHASHILLPFKTPKAELPPSLRLLCKNIDWTAFKMLASAYDPDLMKKLEVTVRLIGRIASIGDDEVREVEGGTIYFYINESSSWAKHLVYSNSFSLKQLKDSLPTMMKHLGHGKFPQMNDM